MDGSGNDWLYGPHFLIENHVILVTINYRLAVLGFLSLNLPEYSGNMGLKDQQLALKWIHANVQRFGGDNSRITIFGQSAGKNKTFKEIENPGKSSGIFFLFTDEVSRPKRGSRVFLRLFCTYSVSVRFLSRFCLVSDEFARRRWINALSRAVRRVAKPLPPSHHYE